MKTIGLLLLSVLTVLAPIKAVVILVGLLVIGDLFLGCWAAKKRGEKLTSAGLRRTISKLFVYETVVIVGFLVELFMTGPMIPVSRIISGYIGLTEIKSVMENLDTITGTDLLKTLIAKLGSDNDTHT